LSSLFSLGEWRTKFSTEFSIHLDADGRIILKSIRTRTCECGLDSSDSGEGPVTDACEHGNRPSGSTKDREFLTS